MEIRELLIFVCRKLYERVYVTATDGNVSTRLPNGNILTTPTGICKGFVQVDELIEVDLESNVVSGQLKPSTEVAMHLFIYKNRPDINSVVHAHPSYATGFATAGIAMDSFVFPEVTVNIGMIPLAKYGTPSTREIVDSLAPYVKSCSAFLLANHGAVTTGKDLMDAYFKMEKLEHSSHTLYIARTLGGERVLSCEDLDKLNKIFLQPKGKSLDSAIQCVINDNKRAVFGQSRKPESENSSEAKLKRIIKSIMNELNINDGK
jgi:L-fuculose-phosphate aldolase